VSSCAAWNQSLGTLPQGCCLTDADCGNDAVGNPQPGSCSPSPNGAPGICMTPVVLTNVYELATSNYLAAGGSGFRALQRNTTQQNSHINQRDAMLDYIRQGRPCGWGDKSTVDGLTACSTDTDCNSAMHPNLGAGAFVCGCTGNTTVVGGGTALTCSPSGASCALNSDGSKSGRCILQACRDQVAQARNTRCETSPDPTCTKEISPCDSSSEICQLISCVDDKLNAIADNRIEMIGH
jgi:5'-nucleotidase